MPGAYDQVVPERLYAAVPAVPGRRRTGRAADARAMVLALVAATYRTAGRCSPFGIVAWCAEHGYSYYRGHLAQRYLDARGVTETHLRPFRLGAIQVDRASVLHERSRTQERFVQLMGCSFWGLAAEHHLDGAAAKTLLELVWLVDSERFVGATMDELSTATDIGHVTLRRALVALAQAGLLAFSAVRGLGYSISLLCWDALVMPPAQGIPARGSRRDAARDNDLVTAVCVELAAAFGLVAGAVAGAGGLRAAIAGALAAGLRPAELTNAVVAGGSLAGLADPIAGLAARAGRAAEALAAQRAAQDQARADARQREADARLIAAAHATKAQDAAAHTDWLARVLDDATLASIAALYTRPGPAQPARALQALVVGHCERALAGASADDDPVALIRASAERRLDEGPMGVLPRAGPGPTTPSLLERLRTLT
jgi:DNA-binding transcriptional ArsR family regulator